MEEFQPIGALFPAPAAGGRFILVVSFFPENRNRAVALFFQLGYILVCLLAGQIDQCHGVMLAPWITSTEAKTQLEAVGRGSPRGQRSRFQLVGEKSDHIKIMVNKMPQPKR